MLKDQYLSQELSQILLNTKWRGKTFEKPINLSLYVLAQVHATPKGPRLSVLGFSSFFRVLQVPCGTEFVHIAAPVSTRIEELIRSSRDVIFFTLLSIQRLFSSQNGISIKVYIM